MEVMFLVALVCMSDMSVHYALTSHFSMNQISLEISCMACVFGQTPGLSVCERHAIIGLHVAML